MAATTDSAGAPGTPEWDPGSILDTPLGHELGELARHILGSGPSAVQAVRAALALPCPDRLEAIRQTAIQCRARDGEPRQIPTPRAGSLAEAAAAELEGASAGLSADEREALALRELTRLSYRQIGQVMGREVPATALLLAQARLSLRAALRGPYPHADAPCAERDRALGILARRLDSEPLDEVDDDWILPHLAECDGCERAHAQMLEASFRYRAWARR